MIKYFIIPLLIAGVLLCPSVSQAEPDTPQDASKAQVPVPASVKGGRFEAHLPGAAWQVVPDSKDSVFFNNKSVQLCIKKASGSIIVVRSGKKDQFGVPEGESYFNLEEPEMAWALKLLPKGDYQGEVKLQVSNPYLARAHAFSFMVKYQSKDCIDLVVTLKDAASKEMVVIDFLAAQANYEQDKADFWAFLGSLKEKGKVNEIL